MDLFKKNPKSLDFYYPLFIEFYFSIGIGPMLFVSKDNLEKEKERFEEELGEDKEFLYPRYRIAVINALEGKLEDAVSAFQILEDELPVSKQRPLKVKEIREFVQFVEGLPRDKDQNIGQSFADQEWINFGFNDELLLKQWKKVGMSPEVAAIWKESGFLPMQAREWKKVKLEPGEAKEWFKLGAFSPKDARTWHKASFSPEDAYEWMECFPDNVSLAVQCKNFGFKDPEIARNWMSEFSFPGEAVSWFEQGFSLEEVKSFKEKGVTDPFLAREEKRRVEKEKEEIEEVVNLDDSGGLEVVED